MKKRDFLTDKCDRAGNGTWNKVFEIVGFEGERVIFCQCFPEIYTGHYDQLLIEDIEKYYTPHERNEPPLVKCQKCDGLGYINYQTLGNQGNPECPRCHGERKAPLMVND